MSDKTEEQTELQELIIKLFPPEKYGEDSNVEELFNRATDLEEELASLREQLADVKAKHLLSIRIMQTGTNVLKDELKQKEDELKQANFWANEQANTLNFLADRNAGLSSELQKSNHNYLLIVDQIKQKEDENRELVDIVRATLKPINSMSEYFEIQKRAKKILENLSA